MNPKILILIILILLIVLLVTFNLTPKKEVKHIVEYKDRLEIRKSNIHDKGIFANCDFKKGDLIETSPYIIIDFPQESNTLSDYIFYLEKNNRKDSVLVLGNGSIFNHSKNNNVDYYRDAINKNYKYYTNRDIKKDEELFINYGNDYWDSRKIVPN